MAFFKLRSQGNEARPAAAAAAPAESVEAMRRRARHRLIGAAVLVLIGVVGFPLLFDTQPRPVAVDIPIEIPDRNKVKPLSVPTAPAPATAAPSEARVAAAPPAAGGMITEASDGSEIKPESKPSPPAVPAPAPRAEAKPEPKSEAKPEAKPEPKPERKPEPKVAEAKPERKSEPKVAEAKPERKPEPKVAEAKPEPKPAEAKAAVKPAATEDAARARALLEGKGADPAAAKAAAAGDDAGRFVVQVGAFADADKAREARQKLEKAGLKTYTHVAKTAEGERTRVRVGPFASRAEADKAAAKVKGLALPASVLTL
jgi:DedD protein